MNLTCNTTLDDLRILPTSELKVAGPLTFHDLALIIAGASTLIAVCMSLYLIWMHALHYTKPNEQRHIIRILFMVPVYAAASFLSLRFYWHAIYFQVISDCYEAFAISSFFALLCSYVRPDLHDQKNYFRDLRAIKGWVAPISWFRKCCGGQRGPWRTPASGLTWFNIIWIGIYQYCFIRVTMTVTAVVTQYFGRYCESSNSPVFSHVWILVIESLAVTIAMYFVIQFYVQMRAPLAEHQPFKKVLAIKLVIFLSFWQSTAISLGTSTLKIVHANAVIAYPDIVVGIPSLLLCFEMACFAIFHIWAFPYRPYKDGARPTFYPVADPDGSDTSPKPNEHFPRSGGFMGLRAIFDALNIWDVIKAFGRGIRWLFVGVRHRREDVSYKTPLKSSEMDLDDLSPQKFNNQGVMMGDGVDTGYHSSFGGMKSTEHLPIATQFRRSRFDMLTDEGESGPGLSSQGGDIGMAVTQGSGSNVGGGGGGGGSANGRRQASDEAAGLIAYAQPMSSTAVGHDHDDGSPERYRDQDNLRHGNAAVPSRGGVYNDDVYGADESSTAHGGGYDSRGRAPAPRPLVQPYQQPQQQHPALRGGAEYPEETQWGEAR
ncbi:uncharacterized protein SPSK_00464 [Sporothrix schenckii 1099-18]|uniref:Uncharacterized protein n=2 Tax=Sporothrix schenckii TaxID=29908 RepID=U7Q6B0_SPOS1|nr:uncharacterized protein SPSK_00464 [Sporothrix schenckii 1099-18]ERT02555.1 hypothetical protein HMPREF1624_00855 [Sporothrix schenckii ATCC 58251]KJR80154.1 hypothetical protein SPSK_00464 [Sporothrix schenckii 1099-18]